MLTRRSASPAPAPRPARRFLVLGLTLLFGLVLSACSGSPGTVAPSGATTAPTTVGQGGIATATGGAPPTTTPHTAAVGRGTVTGGASGTAGRAAAPSPAVGQRAGTATTPAPAAPSGGVTGTDAASAGATPGAAPVAVNPQAGTGATTTVLNPGVVSWVHFGDLHITTADQQNYLDLQKIIADTNQYLKNGVNFAVLPGDNANDDTEGEYQLIKQATDRLQVPLYAVPGDHDHKSGLALYHQYLEPLDYQGFSAGGYHFVFLDVMSGIGADERAWLTQDLDAAKAAGLKSVIVMHSYTAASQLQDVIQRDDVIMVDSGHTHYNDVANDGHTIYAAGRNTGQVTEGPVGFVVANLDNGVISWKFKPLGSWPFVMITSPSDKLLLVDNGQAVKGTVNIRAKIWDDQGVTAATYQIDGGDPRPLGRIGDTQLWSAPWDSTTAGDGDHHLRVTVQGAGGNTAIDEITVVVNQSGTYQAPARSFGPVGNSIGTYADKGLLGNHTSAPGAPAGGGKGAPAPGGASGTPGAGTKPAPGGGKGGPNLGRGPATIVAVDGPRLTVRYADGTTQTVTVAADAAITTRVNGQSASGSLADLQPGQTVDLQGLTGTGDGQTVTGIRIH